MLTKLIVVIILQYYKNTYVAPLKLIKCCLSIIPQFFLKKLIVPPFQQSAYVVTSEDTVCPGLADWRWQGSV